MEMQDGKLRQVRLLTMDKEAIKAHQVEEAREFIMQNGPLFLYWSNIGKNKGLVLSNKPLRKWSFSYKTEKTEN